MCVFTHLQVTKVSADRVAGQQAYILVYVRRDGAEPVLDDSMIEALRAEREQS